MRTVSGDPERLALIVAEAADETYTRRSLTAQVEEVATTVPGSLAPGATVAFCEPNGPGWFIKFLALQKLGVAALPLDAALPPGQRAGAAAALGAHWWWDGPAVTGNWQSLGRGPVDAAEEQDICVVKLTSGSTGEPRALRFTSANMLADGRQIARTMQIGPDDRNLGAIPFGHSYGLGNLVLPMIAQGTVLICSTESLPEALATQVDRHRATILPSVPAILRALAESSVEPRRLRSLRLVISAGAPLRREIAASFHARFGVPIANFYGSSETGGICFDRTGGAAVSAGGVGRPLDGVEVRLDDDERIVVRSAAVIAPGQQTLADRGTWSERGELVLTGRVTPWANIGGKKVSPTEIERAIQELDGVTDAWVGIRARTNDGEDFLLAAVETVRSREDVRQALAECLPAWQVPRQCWVTARLPRTARGKLDRQQLETWCTSAGDAGPPELTAPAPSPAAEPA